MKRSREIPTHLDSIETEIHEAENASSIPEDLHFVQLIDNSDPRSAIQEIKVTESNKSY